jgi:hypothetical protein
MPLPGRALPSDHSRFRRYAAHLQNSRLFGHTVKFAIVFSLMVDGSGSCGCRIFGRLRPVTI